MTVPFIFFFTGEVVKIHFQNKIHKKFIITKKLLPVHSLLFFNTFLFHNIPCLLLFYDISKWQIAIVSNKE